MIRSLATASLVLLSACTQPMLSADMAISNEGVSVYPTLSGVVGGTTISVEPN